MVQGGQEVKQLLLVGPDHPTIGEILRNCKIVTAWLFETFRFVLGIFVFAGEGIKSSRVVLAGGEGAMFQGVLNTETIRKRRKDEPKGAAEKPEKPDDDDDDDAKTERARLVTSSAEADRKPDIFDTHVGPFIESYVLWCQKKGVILGWIPGLVGAGAFIAVALVGGAGLGWLTGQGIIKCLDFFGYVDKIRMYLDATDRA